jgi:ketosteroid isomerase-like protein
MTTEANRQLIQNIFKGFVVGDRQMFRDHLADDFRVVVMGQSSWSGVVEGAEALTRYHDYVRSRFNAPGKTVAERFIADGDIVAVEARGDNYSAEGKRYVNHYCLVYTLKDGKIVEMREYMDTVFCERVLGPKPDLSANAS